MSFFRHKVVHDGEDTFFHFSGVLSTEDNHLSLVEVERNCSIIDYVRDELVGSELTCVENVVVSSVGKVPLQLFGCRSDKHIGHEESVIGTSAHDSDSDPFLGIPTSVAIDYVDKSAGV